ncbi:MAG: sigma 54-interacting transcriptional regulator, partial [Nitrospirota bacterium]|nr:sigma 54-interacting transcriptional regulator [Nitrospirota bacterium]
MGPVCDTCVDRSDYSDIILNSITDGVVTIGLDWQIKYLNKAARAMLGTVEEDVCGHNCRSVIGGHLCGSSCLLKRTMETGENITNYETQIKTRDGRLIPVSINTALLKDKDGRVVGGVEIFRDISLIKELEGELEKKYAFQQIIGKNYKMHEIFELLHEVAPTRTTVLIEGESGTGKELIANAIHHNSPRKSGPFIKVNCAALAEGVLESELFGHVKGSFTGAIADRP